MKTDLVKIIAEQKRKRNVTIKEMAKACNEKETSIKFFATNRRQLFSNAIGFLFDFLGLRVVEEPLVDYRAKQVCIRGNKDVESFLRAEGVAFSSYSYIDDENWYYVTPLGIINYYHKKFNLAQESPFVALVECDIPKSIAFRDEDGFIRVFVGFNEITHRCCSVRSERLDETMTNFVTETERVFVYNQVTGEMF